MKKIFISLSVFIFTGAGIGFCEDADFRSYTGYVNDYANILSDETKAKITGLSREIEDKTTSQLAILTIDTTAPLDIESYAVKLFEKWGIGQKGKNNGVLMVVAVKERAVRIEVGYGLEGAIPDALAKNIIEKSVIPFFKNSDYDSGLLQGSAAIGKLIAREYDTEISGLDSIKVQAPSKELSILDFLFLIFIIIILVTRNFFLFFPILGHGKRKGGYWHAGGGFGAGSGGFGGGFGGFGGGFSGGGGASGRW